MASQQSWTQPFPRTIITVLSVSAVISIIVIVLSAVNLNNNAIQLLSFGPLSGLVLLHHITIYVIVHKTSRTRLAPNVPHGLIKKAHLWLLGLLAFLWTVAVGITVPLGIIFNGASRVYVANIVFVIFEVFALLFLFVVCVRGRKSSMTLPDSDDMDGVDANQLGALASQVQNWHTHPQILAVNIASPRYSWTLLVPRTLYTILSTSAFLSIMTVVLAVADVNSQVVLAATFGPLTYLTIIHHLFMLMVPRLSPSSRAPDIPRFTSNTHLWLLGLLVFGWTVAVCVAVPLGIILADGTKGVFVVDILFMSCEVFALLFLFIICARSRKRLLSNPDGEVNGTGSHGLSGVIGSPTMHYDPPPDYQHETPDEEFFGRTNKTPENNHWETRKKMRNVDPDPSDMLPEWSTLPVMLEGQ